jgi:hypothetical protein
LLVQNQNSSAVDASDWLSSPKTSELEIVIGPTHFAAGIPARNVLARL